MQRWIVAGLVLVLTTGFDAGTPFKQPSKDIVDILDAPPPPATSIAPSRDRMLVLESPSYPPLADLADPVLRLAGIRVNPSTGLRQRVPGYKSLGVQALDGSPLRPVKLPPGARIGVPAWSGDGQRFAFARDLPNGAELWIGDARTATAKPVPRLRLGNVLGATFQWQSDSRRLIVRTVEAGRRAAPPAPRTPPGPLVEEATGKRAQNPTYQDLLKTAHDAALFEHYGRAQLIVLDAATGAATPLGAPGLYSGIAESPDAQHYRVTRIVPPFSTTVPFSSFARAIEIWDAKGRRSATVAELPVADEVPRQGVPTGPRSLQWQPLLPATLVWLEALDGGDPIAKAEFRDKMMSLAAPFTESPRETLRVRHRFSDIDWLAKPNLTLITEYDRERRWTTTTLVDLTSPAGAPKTIFDRSINDAYGAPGSPVYDTRPNGERVVLQDGNAIFLSGSGATPAGDRPFLDRLDLASGEKKRLFQAEAAKYERFIGFEKGSTSRIITRRESRTEPPNLFRLDTATGERRQITDYKDPAPQFQRVTRELVTYKRADGVALSGTLYLPPDHKPGTRLPALVWAYPLEFSDADTAGQVRSAPNRFTLPGGTSPLFLALKGYAVLMDATMPVVGSPETVNNTFVEQITANAKAAVEKLDQMGVADPARILVGGHSYGAFMTANLLAHTDLFVAGIARSGAYNRTLTPFGFQGERRSYWEATELYTKMSPFTHAHKINEPILIIHGEADNNPGTFPVQSERLFQAIRGNGGTARLVMLPHESHGYSARESVLHVLAEMIQWADRWTAPKALAKPGEKTGEKPAEKAQSQPAEKAGGAKR